MLKMNANKREMQFEYNKRHRDGLAEGGSPIIRRGGSILLSAGVGGGGEARRDSILLSAGGEVRRDFVFFSAGGEERRGFVLLSAGGEGRRIGIFSYSTAPR